MFSDPCNLEAVKYTAYVLRTGMYMSEGDERTQLCIRLQLVFFSAQVRQTNQLDQDKPLKKHTFGWMKSEE